MAHDTITDTGSGAPTDADDPAGMQVFAAATWTFRGVVNAASASHPFALVRLGLDGARDGAASAGNSGALTPEQAQTGVLRVTNPLSESIAVTLAFDVALDLRFGTDGLNQAPPPGTHDMALQAAVAATIDGGAPIPMGTLALHEMLTCPSPACSDRYRSSRPALAYEYLDFTLAAGQTAEIALQATAAARVVPGAA